MVPHARPLRVFHARTPLVLMVLVLVVGRVRSVGFTAYDRIVCDANALSNTIQHPATGLGRQLDPGPTLLRHTPVRQSSFRD
jgi:hypothetical protein